MIDRALARQTGLQYVLDSLGPMSPFGAELVRQSDTIADADALRAELARVQSLADNPGRADFTPPLDRALMTLKDIRPSLRRCGSGGTLSLPELFECKSLLLALSEIRALYEQNCPLEGLFFSDVTKPLQILDPRGERRHSFAVEDAATPELFALRREKRAVEARLYKTGDEAERTRLRLRRDAICAGEDAQERAVCASLSAALAPYADALLSDCESAGRLDLLLRKAAMTDGQAASVPRIEAGGLLCMDAMTNPELAALVEARGGRFVPVSLCLRRGAAVITGANMGGKTVALKTLALNVLLAASGFPVYARRAVLPPIVSLRFLSADAEDAAQGLSSFGAEVVRLREALEAHRADSLLLLDEPARGTNPDEGAAIVRGVVEYLNRQDGFAVVATHYDGIAAHASCHYRIVGLRDMDPETAARELETSGLSGPELIARRMDYGLYPCEPSDPCPREALAICRLLKLPEPLMAEIRHFYEKSTN